MTSTYVISDEGLTSDILLPFAFPMGGNNYNYIAVSSNGELYLDNGAGVTNAPPFGTYGVFDLRGGPGGSPRLQAVGTDLQAVAGQPWDIKVDDTVAGQVKISWEHVQPFFSTGNEDWSMSITLLSGGAIQFDYSDGDFGTGYLTSGISAGNDVGTGNEPVSDLNVAGSSGALPLLYQDDFPPFDLNDQGILFIPNGLGGYDWIVTCGIAKHTSYGAGCYENTTFPAMYSYFPDTITSQALAGQSYTFVPNGTGYTWIAGGNPYVAPTGGALDLGLLDDSEADVTPSVPFNFLGNTPIPTVSVNSNGFVNMGPSGNNFIYSYASVYELLNAAIPSFRSNADYNPGAAGSGHVFSEEVGGVLYCTWNGVYRYGNTTPETMQIQLELSTGVVTIVYGTMATTGFGMVIGYAPAGPSTDNGSLDLSTALPYVSTSVHAVNMTATPRPISTASTGTTVTYTVHNSPEIVPGSGLVAGLLIVSLTQNPGLDLGFLGAPGCSLYIGSLDLSLSFVGAAGPQDVTFVLPPGVAPGTLIFAQAASLAPVNTFGIATSNGIESLISDN